MEGQTVEMTFPRLIYGTAWKKARTADLVYEAIKSGFRALDTACQPKHYEEKLVGDGIRKALSQGIVKREDLFIQTKYTSPNGQDPNRTPYDFNLPIPEQVKISINTSLQNLHTPDGESPTYLDSVVLHTPLPTWPETLLAWKTLQTFVSTGQILALGISNCPADTLLRLLQSPETSVQPSFVQNRFYPATRYDVEVRKICREHGIVFQSFWTLTGNPELLGRKGGVVGRVAEKVGVSREAALYALVCGLSEGGVSVLCGTTSKQHMDGDIRDDDTIRRWIEEDDGGEWELFQEAFLSEIA